MRMRRKQMKTYHLRRRITARDKEGGSIVIYDDAIEIKATIWPASGRIQAEMYGERLAYMKNMEYAGVEAIKEGDGICIFVPGEEKPDYRVVSVKQEYNPKVIELEKTR